MHKESVNELCQYYLILPFYSMTDLSVEPPQNYYKIVQHKRQGRYIVLFGNPLRLEALMEDTIEQKRLVREFVGSGGQNL